MLFGVIFSHTCEYSGLRRLISVARSEVARNYHYHVEWWSGDEWTSEFLSEGPVNFTSATSRRREDGDPKDGLQGRPLCSICQMSISMILLSSCQSFT